MHPVSYISRRLLNHGPFLRRPLTRLFNQLYWYLGQRGETWSNTFFRGVKLLKFPTDLWIYQEIIFETKPDLIIETGTAWGGSALYLASLCDTANRGTVISIDINPIAQPRHPRITYLTGSSTSPEILKQIRPDGRVMVILDSDHSRDHVLKELDLYSPLVTEGNYLIVEDTILNGRPILPEHGPGPMEAVRTFIKHNRDFEIDRSREKFLLTSNPKGFLRRV